MAVAVPVVLSAFLLVGGTSSVHSLPVADNLNKPVEPAHTSQVVSDSNWLSFIHAAPTVTATVPVTHHKKKVTPPAPTVTQTPVVHPTVTASTAPTVTVSGSVGQKVLQYAETQLGLPYVYGGEAPGVDFDCSGLTQWAYAQAGVSIPRVADDQFHYFRMIPKSQAQIGDLVFFHSDSDLGSYVYHVGIYVGHDDMMVVAPTPGQDVQIQNFDWGGDTVSFGTLS